MSEVIHESGLRFACPGERTLFLEKSSVYKSLGEGIRTVEFILLNEKNAILLVEAKSSSPRPDNHEDFDVFIREITEKFTHSIDIHFSLILKRLLDEKGELPDLLKSADYSTVNITLLLVINGHPIEWLAPIAEELRSKLRRHIKTWQLKLTVINHEQAKEQGFLVQ